MNDEIQEFDFTPLEDDLDSVAATEVVYYNDKNEVVTKEEGSFVKITEFDSSGNIIRDIWGTCDNQNDEEINKTL